MSTLNPYAPPNPQPDDDPPLVAQLAIEGEGMTVEFEQTFDDVLAFQYYLIEQMGVVAPSRRAWITLGLLALIMLMCLAILMIREDLRFLAGIPVIGLAVVASVAALWPYMVWYYRWNVRRVMKNLTRLGQNLNLLGVRRIVITPEFFVYSSPAFQTAYRWFCLEKILVVGDNLFILTSAIDAIVIPRRAFNSEVHFQEFTAQAMNYLASKARKS